MTIWNFSWTSIVQFRASRYIMHLNRTSAWQVVSIWISREHSLFNFERLDILSASIGVPCEKLGPSEFLESIRCSISCILICDAPELDSRVKSYVHLNFSRASAVQFRASRYTMRPNRTSVWNVMTIWIFQELPSFNFERQDILCARIGPLCETLWPLEFLESFRWTISRVSLYYVPESDSRMKSYDHFNFSSASVVKFRGSRYIMRLNRTSELKVMTIWSSRELSLFNFERLDMGCAWLIIFFLW